MAAQFSKSRRGRVTFLSRLRISFASIVCSDAAHTSTSSVRAADSADQVRRPAYRVLTSPRFPGPAEVARLPFPRRRFRASLIVSTIHEDNLVSIGYEIVTARSPTSYVGAAGAKSRGGTGASIKLSSAALLPKTVRAVCFGFFETIFRQPLFGQPVCIFPENSIESKKLYQHRSVISAGCWRRCGMFIDSNRTIRIPDFSKISLVRCKV